MVAKRIPQTIMLMLAFILAAFHAFFQGGLTRLDRVYYFSLGDANGILFDCFLAAFKTSIM